MVKVGQALIFLRLVIKGTELLPQPVETLGLEEASQQAVRMLKQPCGKDLSFAKKPAPT